MFVLLNSIPFVAMPLRALPFLAIMTNVNTYLFYRINDERYVFFVFICFAFTFTLPLVRILLLLPPVCRCLLLPCAHIPVGHYWEFTSEEEDNISSAYCVPFNRSIPLPVNVIYLIICLLNASKLRRKTKQWLHWHGDHYGRTVRQVE